MGKILRKGRYTCKRFLTVRNSLIREILRLRGQLETEKTMMNAPDSSRRSSPRSRGLGRPSARVDGSRVLKHTTLLDQISPTSLSLWVFEVGGIVESHPLLELQTPGDPQFETHHLALGFVALITTLTDHTQGLSEGFKFGGVNGLSSMAVDLLLLLGIHRGNAAASMESSSRETNARGALSRRSIRSSQRK